MPYGTVEVVDFHGCEQYNVAQAHCEQNLQLQRNAVTSLASLELWRSGLGLQVVIEGIIAKVTLFRVPEWKTI